MNDLISRQTAIDELKKIPDLTVYAYCSFLDMLMKLPSAQPTLYGYPIEHLEMIARVMAKENCTPEIVAQMLQNAGEIAKMVRDEMMRVLEDSVKGSLLERRSE